jgi:hypothetical protein
MGDMVPSILRKEIPTFWLIPLSLIGLPFLLGTMGRTLGAFGAANLGEALLQAARIYGGLPTFVLGLNPLAIANTKVAYIAAGISYSGLIFLLIVGGGFVRRLARRSRRVV